MKKLTVVVLVAVLAGVLAAYGTSEYRKFTAETTYSAESEETNTQESSDEIEVSELDEKKEVEVTTTPSPTPEVEEEVEEESNFEAYTQTYTGVYMISSDEKFTHTLDGLNVNLVLSDKYDDLLGFKVNVTVENNSPTEFKVINVEKADPNQEYPVGYCGC